tara:strand:+ start:767 stop:1060 length:294 start_codon:yes stop_codon:yes gene_type:complete
MDELKEPDWDYKQNLYFEPCASYDCEGYILLMRGHLTYFKGANEPEYFDKFIPTASISVGDMYDLFANVCEKLDIESARSDLQKQLDKKDSDEQLKN